MDKVNLRQKREYIADDGRHVEAFETIKKIESPANNDDKPNEILADNIYYGIIIVETPVGHQQMRFPIPDANTLDEAFNMYYDVREAYIEEIESQIEARKDKQIITPGNDLNHMLQEKAIIDQTIQR